jgi:hypothetical protein
LSELIYFTNGGSFIILYISSYTNLKEKAHDEVDKIRIWENQINYPKSKQQEFTAIERPIRNIKKQKPKLIFPQFRFCYTVYNSPKFNGFINCTL